MSKEKVLALKEQGKSNREIAKVLDVSVQYVWATLSGYTKKYQTTDKYRKWQREYKRNKKGTSDDR